MIWARRFEPSGDIMGNMPRCENPDKTLTRRCGVENINWAPLQEFAKCPSCGDACKLWCVDEDVLSVPQSRVLAAQLAAHAAAEVDRAAKREAANAELLERAIRAATVSLRYDMEVRWPTMSDEEMAEWMR